MVKKNYMLAIGVLAVLLMFNGPAASAWDFEDNFTTFQNDTSDTTGEDRFEDLPLEPERTVSFNTSEGTWLSLDVSPDGSQIAFDMLGDIYTMPTEGGEATRLTEGMAFDSHPKYSPDGKYILFTSDRSGSDNAWYINLETEETHQVTHESNENVPGADWSPDGKYIVVAKGDRNIKLFLYHKDGGSGTQLIDSPGGLKTIDPAFGANGRFIYYSRRMGAWNYNAQLPQYQIGIYDRNNGETSTITSRYGSGFTPALSPNGKWLVYGSRYEDQTGLVLRNLDTGSERWLAYPVQRDDQESIASMGVYPAMSFTPDSEHLVASYGGKIWKISIDGGEAQEIPFEADVELAMGPQLDFQYPISDERDALASQIRDAVMSPDGSMMAFTALNKLYLMDYPDGTPERVTGMDVIEAQPAWSPNGEWLAYATWDAENGGALYKVDVTSRRRNPVKLTEESAVYAQPAWSYTQDRIVFLKGPGYDFKTSGSSYAYFGSLEDIAWVSTDGGEVNFIAKADGRNNPHFVKNSDRIYMNRGNTLVSLRYDGTDQEEYISVRGIRTYGSSNPSSASEVTMAPEGDQALAKVNNNVYVVTVPKVGKTTSISVARPDNAQFPARKLTEYGGEFPSWSDNGNEVYYSLGSYFFNYNLDEAEAFEDSVKAAKKEKEEEKEMDEEEGDVEQEAEEADEEEKESPDEYKATETHIQVHFQRDIPESSVVLQGARIITMNGDEMIENGDVLVVNNRIEAVGPSGSLDVPSGAQTIDVSGKTIIPGFVDTHAHIRPTFGIHKSEAWSYWANLAYGVTTTRDPQTGTTDVLAYGDMVESGEMLGPRVYSTGPGVGYWAYNMKSQEQARDVLKQYSKYYDTKYIKMYLTGNRKHRQWIIKAAKEQKLLPTTEGGLDWKLNLTQMIDGYPGHEHSFPILPLYKDVITSVAESQMAYTPTLLVAYGGPWAENYYYATEKPYNSSKLSYFTPYEELASKSRRRGFWSMKEEHVFYKLSAQMTPIIEQGGLAGVGSHGQLQGLGYHWELWATQAGGMSEHQALKVATIIGAKSLGLEGDLGSIETGKLADLIILDRNPLENIKNTNSVRYVMKNGRLYEGDSLDEIYPRQREATGHWWGNIKPAEGLPGIKK